jgi:hypothetical protein
MSRRRSTFTKGTVHECVAYGDRRRVNAVNDPWRKLLADRQHREVKTN